MNRYHAHRPNRWRQRLTIVLQALILLALVAANIVLWLAKAQP